MQFQGRHAENIHEVKLDMGAFNLNARKTTVLCTNAPWAANLARRMEPIDRERIAAKRLCTRVVTRDCSGRRRVKGGPDLKGTQAYPLAFGVAVAELYWGWRRANPGRDRLRPVLAGRKRLRPALAAGVAADVLAEWPVDDPGGAWFLQDLLRGELCWDSNVAGEFTMGPCRAPRR